MTTTTLFIILAVFTVVYCFNRKGKKIGNPAGTQALFDSQMDRRCRTCCCCAFVYDFGIMYGKQVGYAQRTHYRL